MTLKANRADDDKLVYSNLKWGCCLIIERDTKVTRGTVVTCCEHLRVLPPSRRVSWILVRGKNIVLKLIFKIFFILFKNIIFIFLYWKKLKMCYIIIFYTFKKKLYFIRI